jgi:hypothetical protein
MASILVLSENGSNVMWAKKLSEDGHIVKMWIHHNTWKLLLDSKNPSLLKAPTKLVEQFDLILGDYGLGTMCDEIKREGKHVLFGSHFIDLMVIDPAYHTRLIEIVYNREPAQPDDNDVLTSAWFHGGTFKLKTRSRVYERMMEGDRGSRHGDMGCTIEFIDEAPILDPLATFLTDLEYVGPIHVRHLNDEVKMVVPGYYSNVQQALFELIKGDRFSSLYKLCEGDTPDTLTEKAMSIKLSVPPYPYPMPSERYVWNVDNGARKHIWNCDGVNGVLGYVTSRGTDLSECRRRAYRTIRLNVSDRDVQYRSDIGDA